MKNKSLLDAKYLLQPQRNKDKRASGDIVNTNTLQQIWFAVQEISFRVSIYFIAYIHTMSMALYFEISFLAVDSRRGLNPAYIRGLNARYL